MSEIPSDLLYTEEHEYLKATGETGIYAVGITDYAQGELGDIVYVELPASGESVKRSETFGTVEAVKAVSDLYSPVTGEVVEANAALADDPALINRSPYEDGWLVRLRVEDETELDNLMSAEEYASHVGEG